MSDTPPAETPRHQHVIQTGKGEPFVCICGFSTRYAKEAIEHESAAEPAETLLWLAE